MDSRKYGQDINTLFDNESFGEISDNIKLIGREQTGLCETYWNNILSQGKGMHLFILGFGFDEENCQKLRFDKLEEELRSRIETIT